jgi:general secretion pathway protein D
MQKATRLLLIGIFLLTGCASTPPKAPQTSMAQAESTTLSDSPSVHKAARIPVVNAADVPPPAAGADSGPVRSGPWPATPSNANMRYAPIPLNAASSVPVTYPPPTVPLIDGTVIPVATEDQVEPLPQPLESKEGPVQINFDNADLGEVIRTFAQLMDLKYVLDANVRGSVTIHTAGGVERKHLFPLFLQILEVNGLAAVKNGPLYRITDSKTATRLPIHLSGDRLAESRIPFSDRFMIQIIPLRHISAGEMSKLLAPFASEGATIVAHESTNTLVIVDKVINIAKILKMADSFDISLFERVQHRFYLLENGAAKETAAMLEDIFAVSGKKGTVRFIPIERLNAVLALSADPAIFLKADQFMMQLDAPGEGIEPRIYVYFVRNGGAEELAALLNAVFDRQQNAGSRGQVKENPRFGFSRNPFAIQPNKPLVPKVKPPTTFEDLAEKPVQPETAAPPSTPQGDVLIIPDLVRNALIIEATPSDYRVIASILTKIDVLPRQVLIEAMIAEISLDDKFELGVEWEYTREREDETTGLLSGTISGDGLTYAIAFSQELVHNLDALASENKVNILSSPHVLASDGKTAKIDVSNEIPIVSSETIISSSAEPLVTTDIEYRDTGVLLSVTPHINENGLVTMDVYQEVSEQGEDVNVAGENYPSFFKRSVDTTLTVGHDQTIVLGGLIRENKGQNRSGVPGLMDVPLLGWLFGDRDQTYDKAELIILLTPKVITSLDDVKAVTDEFERKVSQTMQYIQEKQSASYVKP